MTGSPLADAFLAGLFGLLIGSFLNVCIHRMPRDLSVVRPRSFCPQCEAPIAWFDNIPLISYLALGGRCRKCKAGIPWRYPLVEFLTAAAFFCAIYALGVNAKGFKFCAYGAILIALIFSDLEERILPDEFTIGGTVLGFLFAAFVPLRFGLIALLFHSVRNARMLSVGESIFAATFCGAALWGVGALYYKLRHREGLGLGDVKMIMMIAAFLGIETALLTLIAGSVLGSVVGILYIWGAGKDAATYELPFGSFLGIAALAIGFVGDAILHWYGGLGA
jgi:leader peptidase (prepilin peptidase)/N-methyltransferase